MSSEFSEKASEVSEAMRLVKLAADPVGDNVKAAIVRAANSLGWSFTRTRDVWYGDARRIDSHEMDGLRAVERRRDANLVAIDMRKHIAQVAALRARLCSLDPDFYRNDIAALDFLMGIREGA